MAAVARAVRVRAFGPASVLQVESVPVPVPGADEVRVRVHAVGVNPVDAYIRSGTHAVKPTLPYTPGRDAAGVIEAVGADAARTHAVGQRVFTLGTVSGAYAEVAIVKAANAVPLSAKLDFAQGACLGVPYYSAYRALVQKAKAAKGETVFIHGASGAVGTATVQLARAYGLRVIGTAGTDAGLELVRKVGAHDVLDHTKPDHMDRLKDLTGGTGPEIIIEMLANQNLAVDLKAAVCNGRVVIVGSRGQIAIDPRDIMSRELSVTGIMLLGATAAETDEATKAITAGIEEGYVVPIVGKTLPLDAAAAAHELLVPAPGQPSSGTVGNVVLLP